MFSWFAGLNVLLWFLRVLFIEVWSILGRITKFGKHGGDRMVTKASDGLQLGKIFLKEKPSLALVTIRQSRDEIYPRKISKQIDCTYAHTVKILSNMNDLELVMSRKEGRKKVLELTEKGELYADALLDVVQTDKSVHDLKAQALRNDILESDSEK